MNKELAIEVARGVLKQWAANLTNSSNFYVKYDCEVTPEKLIITITNDGGAWTKTDNRPRYESLDPSKGLLLFLKAIHTMPGLSSWKNYCIMTGNKTTSFGTLRTNLIGNGLVTDKYQVTELGQRLLEAYELI